MKKTISTFSALTIVVATSICMLTMGFFVSTPHAHAESPDILAGSDLSVGSTGQGVVVLQGLLSEMGYLNVPVGTTYGYYGSLTQAALGKYQASQNVSPTAGYFGERTKTAMYNDLASRNWLVVLGWQS